MSSFSSILGITTRIVKVLKRSFSSQSHKIKAQCLTLWSDLVTHVLKDDLLANSPSENAKSSDILLLNDPQWLGKAQDHLYQHMQIFASMTVQNELKIREALLGLCTALQQLSWETLQNTRPLQVCQ